MMDIPFENEQVELAHIPKSDNLQFIPLERDYLKVLMMIAGIMAFIFFIAGIILFFGLSNKFPGNIRLAMLVGMITIALINFFFLYKSYFFKSYALRQKDIVFKSGYLFRTKTCIPFNRVQHCEVNQGPVDRMFNLASLRIFTAGGSSSDMSVPGLRPEIANDLKQFIVKKTARIEEE